MSSVKTPNASDPSNGGQSAGVPDVQGGPGGTQNKSDGEKYRREQFFADCDAGNHKPESSFKLHWVIASIVCFPICIPCCCLDKKVKCKQCGIPLDSKGKSKN